MSSPYRSGGRHEERKVHRDLHNSTDNMYPPLIPPQVHYSRPAEPDPHTQEPGGPEAEPPPAMLPGQPYSHTRTHSIVPNSYRIPPQPHHMPVVATAPSITGHSRTRSTMQSPPATMNRHTRDASTASDYYNYLQSPGGSPDLSTVGSGPGVSTSTYDPLGSVDPMLDPALRGIPDSLGGIEAEAKPGMSPIKERRRASARPSSRSSAGVHRTHGRSHSTGGSKSHHHHRASFDFPPPMPAQLQPGPGASWSNEGPSGAIKMERPTSRSSVSPKEHKHSRRMSYPQVSNPHSPVRHPPRSQSRPLGLGINISGTQGAPTPSETLSVPLPTPSAQSPRNIHHHMSQERPYRTELHTPHPPHLEYQSEAPRGLAQQRPSPSTSTHDLVPTTNQFAQLGLPPGYGYAHPQPGPSEPGPGSNYRPMYSQRPYYYGGYGPYSAMGGGGPGISSGPSSGPPSGAPGSGAYGGYTADPATYDYYGQPPVHNSPAMASPWASPTGVPWAPTRYGSMGGPKVDLANDLSTDPDDDLMNVPGNSYESEVHTAWTPQDVEELLKLLESGERFKWKYISEALSRRQEKRIPIKACQNKFQGMFGETESGSLLRTSLFYIAYRTGWDAIKNERTEMEREGEGREIQEVTGDSNAEN